ncbi:tRNA (adenosine(37)-N6)-threonylcarbamoyltransferase complex dimerization subunit type 1 TsaB [Chlamydia sp.]|uniref:tRNA threonylcarbamoyladenosine biosynthesis protein TsaB n=1 Tax=Chlamydia sp. TaxID=35827 RepID=UPI0025C62944|nr:tRNA (adenosine(37)-N6)-threonylcarbamoyltransferase complex dimerization subunit type 1 TsaB [Chlamydia sp.]MBQ8498253.1 tRNA threonylcarbamoyladenosine biosynthesis protein TsaB [Chlamydia sp.]
MYKYFIIDTSGSQPFLAYVDCQAVLEVWSLPTGEDQGSVLNCIFNNLSLPFKGIGVAIGPGRFSATRVGVSFAQGLSLAKKVPLVGYSSLEGYLPLGEKETALLLPLGKKGGVVALDSEVSADGFLFTDKSIVPGALMTYPEALEYCLEKRCCQVVSPDPLHFIEIFSPHIPVKKVAPRIDQIRKYVVSQFLLPQDLPLSLDYRSVSSFF